MNQDTIEIAFKQFSDPMHLWLLLIFVTPMIAGAITTFYSHRAQTKIDNEVWEYWRNNEKFQNQKVTKSINYNEPKE